MHNFQPPALRIDFTDEKCRSGRLYIELILNDRISNLHRWFLNTVSAVVRAPRRKNMKWSPLLAVTVPVALAAWCPPRPADSFEQKQIFDLFVRTLLIDKKIEAAYYEHVSPHYIQHNPSVLTGRENSISVLSELVPRANFTFYHTSVGSNIALLHHRVDWEDKAKHPTWTMAADIFRMDGTCIMEHWDCLMEAPEYGINPLPWISK